MLNLTPLAAADVGNAQGVVTLNGTTLGLVKITLHRNNGHIVGPKVKDGKFTIDNIAAGKFKVTIESKGVPEKYKSEETTDLSVKVEEGANVLDFVLVQGLA